MCQFPFVTFFICDFPLNLCLSFLIWYIIWVTEGERALLSWLQQFELASKQVQIMENIKHIEEIMTADDAYSLLLCHQGGPLLTFCTNVVI